MVKNYRAVFAGGKRKPGAFFPAGAKVRFLCSGWRPAGVKSRRAHVPVTDPPGSALGIGSSIPIPAASAVLAAGGSTDGRAPKDAPCRARAKRSRGRRKKSAPRKATWNKAFSESLEVMAEERVA